MRVLIEKVVYRLSHCKDAVIDAEQSSMTSLKYSLEGSRASTVLFQFSDAVRSLGARLGLIYLFSHILVIQLITFSD